MSETTVATPPMTTTAMLTGDEARIHCEALGIPVQESVAVEVMLRKPPATFVHRHTVPATADLRSVFTDVYNNLAKGDRWEALVAAIIYRVA